MQRPRLSAVFLTIVIDLLGFGLILPLLPLYARDYGASNAMVGLILGSFSAMQFLSAPLWGKLSDRIGRRPVMLVGLVGSIASYILFALAELPADESLQLTLLFVSRIAAGIFGGTITAALAYIADVTPVEERGRGMALVGAAFGVGFLIGPALGGLGHDYIGPMAPGFLAAGLSAFALLYAFFRVAEPPRHKTAEARGLRLDALRRTLGIPGVRTILLLTFLSVVAFGIFEATLALLAYERFDAWDPKSNGWLFSYVGLWLVIAQGWFVRRYMGRVGERRFIVIGSVCLVVGLLAVGYAQDPLLLGAVTTIAVFGSAMITPSLASLLSQRTDAASQGEVLGANQSIQSLARIASHGAGPALLGLGLLVPYWVGAGIMLAALFLGLRLARE